MTDRADVTEVKGASEPEVEAGGGTSTHDVAGWFPCKDFWISAGTEYTAEIAIRKDDKRKRSAYSQKEGFHYQLEPAKLMTVGAFKGALDNMARPAQQSLASANSPESDGRPDKCEIDHARN